MTARRIVIAGTNSGAGKTTVTIGLMAALKKRGFVVQGFKCGPDYIDPTYHTVITGRPSRNIDGWMLGHNVVRDIVARASQGADISMIEGVMGMFDGKSPTSNVGSTAEISVITNSPVLLVVNCASMARSAAAIVKGFQAMADGARIVGVIANRVGSEGHYKLVKTAIEQECGIPVVGYLLKNADISVPERHLGLVPSIERGDLDPFFTRLTELIEATVDIDLIYELAMTEDLKEASDSIFSSQVAEKVTIAVAKDAAFNFYYEENFELLESYGAKLCYFSPLKNEPVPAGADSLYLGGGYPEEFANVLANNEETKQSIRNFIEDGKPVLAECGGYMYLNESIETTSGEVFNMVGLIPGKVKMQTKLAALGYREIKGRTGNFLLDEQMSAKGHEFHFSKCELAGEVTPAYETKGMRGVKQEGYMNGNVVAGYTHFHFASNPAIVERWIEQCVKMKQVQ